MPALAPVLQIVTTVLSERPSDDRGQQPVRDVPRAGDVALVALVGLAHVEQDHAVLRDESLELVQVDRFELRLAAGRVDDEPVELEQADGVEAASRLLRLIRGARVHDDPVAVQDERSLRRERVAATAAR